MATRHQARQCVISLLYANEFSPQNSTFVEEFLGQNKIKNEQKAFALDLLQGVSANLTQLDELLGEFVDTQNAVSAIDLAILRLGVYEFTHFATDRAVIINEAIELCKEFGSENSTKFINAVLDKIKNKLKSEEK